MGFYSLRMGRGRTPTPPKRPAGVQTTKREHAKIIRETDPDTSTCQADVPTIGHCGTPITGIQVSRVQRLVGCIRCRWVSLGLCWECGLLPHQHKTTRGESDDVLCVGCRITRNSATRPLGAKKKRGRPRQ